VRRWEHDGRDMSTAPKLPEPNPSGEWDWGKIKHRHNMIGDGPYLDCQGGHSGAFKRAHTAVGLTGSAKASTVGDELKATLAAMAARLGDYPGGLKDRSGLSSAAPKQTTRMLKVECPQCGFTFRTTLKWIDSCGADLRCPDAGCAATCEVAA